MTGKETKFTLNGSLISQGSKANSFFTPFLVRPFIQCDYPQIYLDRIAPLNNRQTKEINLFVPNLLLQN